MRDKDRNKNRENKSNVQNEESFEISETGYGLESVEKGTDFAAGDSNTSPGCGGL